MQTISQIVFKGFGCFLGTTPLCLQGRTISLACNSFWPKTLCSKFCYTCCKSVEKFARKYTAQKMKFSIKDLFSKCDQIRSYLRIWSHLLKKSSMENFIFLCSDSSSEAFDKTREGVNVALT